MVTAPTLGRLAGLDVARVAVGWSRQSNGFVGRNGGDAIVEEDGGDRAAELHSPGLQDLGPIEFVDGGRLDAKYLGTAIPFGEGKFQLQWSWRGLTGYGRRLGRKQNLVRSCRWATCTRYRHAPACMRLQRVGVAIRWTTWSALKRQVFTALLSGLHITFK